MGEIINTNNSNEAEVVKTGNDIIKLTEEMLLDVRASVDSKKTLNMPIAALSTLGAGVSSLIPALNTITQTTTVATEGFYQVANAGIGDVLKNAGNGNLWGALKTADGASKMAQFKAADMMTATVTTTTPINPAIMMMAVALFSIEKELSDIAETAKQILSFLEVEKESEIEADVETLINIVTTFKFSWDNENFVNSNHKLVLDIQRTARKNINAYQKMLSDVLNVKQIIVTQNKMNSTLVNLEKKFKYYRLSLYTFSLASLLEIMLSGNFKEEYILGIKGQINEMSQTYRNLFGECSLRLEKMGSSALETNVLKGLGAAGKVVGKSISIIPLVKDGPVDEFLQDKGTHLKSIAIGMEKKSVGAFAPIGDPNTRVFVEKMQDIVQIYNHTSQICFDKEKIYLMTD